MGPVNKRRSVLPFVVAVLSVWILPYWNFRLSPIINTLNLVDNVLSVLITPLHMIPESDVASINKERFIYANLPLGFRAELQSISHIVIPTPEGHSLAARVYTPFAVKPNAPIIVYFHGGGYVIGDVPMYEFVTTNIAAKTSYIVVSVEYRLAPEHKFPAAHMDAIAATQWIHQHASELGGDAQRIAVAGDSAGGNLAAIVAAELSHIVKYQSLIYPGITFAVFSDSAASNAYAPVLPLSRVTWFSRRYFRSVQDLLHPLACPLSRDLTGLPPAHVITAEYDVLRDEGEEYANKLEAAGVPVVLKRYNNTVHGFFGSVLFTHGVEALDDVCVELVKFFG